MSMPHSSVVPLPSISDATSTLLHSLRQHDYSTAMVLRVLGSTGVSAASARSPQAALWYARRSDAPQLERHIVTAFYLRQAVDQHALEDLLTPGLVADLLGDGVLVEAAEGTLRCAIDIRPITFAPHAAQDVLIASDPDASMEDRIPGADHVPGVGHASLSLLNVIPPVSPGSSILDLGCGSGVLSLVLADHSDNVTVIGTDLSQRAIEFANANGSVPAAHSNAPKSSRVSWRQGSWFEPAAGEQFDMIVANPPFVIGPAVVGHVYRDSGLTLDGATSTVVGGAAEHLMPGGTAHILAGWALEDSESAASRVSSWLPSHGVRAWVVQREEVDTATYVTTWLQDEGLDPRHHDGRQRTQAWMDFFADNGISRIGLGFVHIQRIDDDQPTELTFEVLDHPLPAGTYLGLEAAEFFARAQWLSEQDADGILAATYAVRPTTALEQVGLPRSDEYSSQGFVEYVTRLSRTDGPAWSHEVDEPVVKILSGLHPQALSLEDVIELYCASQALDSEDFTSALLPIVVDLVRHGMIIPAELLDEDDEESHRQ